jgi:MerR family transcriptional regulator, light-induced transcriptional regulator
MDIGQRAEDAPGVGVPAAPELRPDQQVTLTVAAVAARLGVAPSTLRTWDRRYGLGPSGRSAGSHRRYTAEDVARLETMRRLTLQGAPPSDAARVAASSEPVLHAVPPQATPATEPEGPVFVDDLTLAAAAANGEDGRVRRMVQWVVRERGLVGAWCEIGQPALAMLAQRVSAERPGRLPAMSIAAAVLAAARASAEDAPPPSDDRCRVVFVADLDGGADIIGAHVLAASLAERAAVARVLQATDDVESLERAVESLKACVLAVVGRPGAGLDLARSVAERGVAVFMIGPDVPDVWIPGVHRVRTFEGAIHEIAGALDAVREGLGESASERRGPWAADGWSATPS